LALLYVCNFEADSVAAFADAAHGDTAPLRTIRGPRSGLHRPVGIALDGHGRLHVANAVEDAGVTVHSALADGDATPLHRLLIRGVLRAIAVGPDGDLFVARTSSRGHPAPAVLHVPEGASCSDRILCGPATGITHPVGLALDGRRRLFVVNAFGGIVAIHAAAAEGDMAPLRAFTPACGDARSVVVGAGALVVGGTCVCVYDIDAGRGARPLGVFGHSPTLALQGADGLALGTTPRPSTLRVVDLAARTVHAIGPSALPALHGDATGLDGPIAACIDADPTPTTRSIGTRLRLSRSGRGAPAFGRIRPA
jgi:hypothetical protein